MLNASTWVQGGASSGNVIVAHLLVIAFLVAFLGLALSLDWKGRSAYAWRVASVLGIFLITAGMAIAGPESAESEERFFNGKYTLLAIPIVFIAYAMLYAAILRSQGSRVGRDRFFAKVFVASFAGTVAFIVAKESMGRSYDMSLLYGSGGAAGGGWAVFQIAKLTAGADNDSSDTEKVTTDA